MPFSYYATIPNLPELQKRFQEAPQITLVAVRDAVNKSLTNYQREAKLNAPVDTGRLRQGILVKPATITAGGSLTKVSGSVNATANYSAAVELGTGIYGPNKAPILPKKKPYFTFKTKGGGWVRVKSIRGMRGRFYMRDALENNQATTNGYFDEAAETITRRLTEK